VWTIPPRGKGPIDEDAESQGQETNSELMQDPRCPKRAILPTPAHTSQRKDPEMHATPSFHSDANAIKHGRIHITWFMEKTEERRDDKEVFVHEKIYYRQRWREGGS